MGIVMAGEKLLRQFKYMINKLTECLATRKIYKYINHVGKWPIENDITFNPGSNACIKWKSTDNVGITKSYYRYQREGSSLERTSDPLPSKSYLAKPAGRSGDYSWFYPAETVLNDNDPGGGPGTYYIALVAEDAAGNKYERDNVCRIIVEY